MTLATLPDTTSVYSVPSVVYVNPTNLTNEAGYGTPVGLLESRAITRFRFETRKSGGNHTGARPTMEWFLGAWWEFELRIKTFGAAALGLAFPGMVSGSNVRTPGAAPGAALIPGTNLVSGSTYKKTILLMPIDECTVNPCWLAQKAICYAKGSLEWGADGELILPIQGTCYEAAGNEVYRQFFIGDKASASII